MQQLKHIPPFTLYTELIYKGKRKGLEKQILAITHL